MSNALDIGASADAHAQVGPVEALFQVKAELESVGKKLDRQRQLFERLARRVPMHYDAIGSAVAPASGVCVIDLSSGGLPSTGRVWEVKRWVVGSVGVQTAAGQAWLLTTGQQAGVITAASGVPVQDVVDSSPTGASLPWGNTFGTRQVMVNDNERLLVVIIGATSGATYNAGASADDYPTDAELGINQIPI